MAERTNYIKHLNAVFEQFSKDGRLNPTHVSLYIALFQLWNINFFKEEFYINREEVMRYSKIGSTATYHKCIKNLSHWKYLLYIPSHNPFKGSRIKMFNFETSGDQALNDCRTNNQTSAEQALIRINKPIQTIENNKNNSKRKNFKNSNSSSSGNHRKPVQLVQNRDNLKTSSDKNYNEPL